MEISNHLAEKQIRERIISNHNKVEVVSGKCRYNYKCHMNAVHDALEKGDKKVAMCVCVGTDGGVFIHFINYRKGVYTDNTLGKWSEHYEYYFIRWIGKKEFWSINTIFGDYRESLRKSLTWWVRLTSNFEA